MAFGRKIRFAALALAGAIIFHAAACAATASQSAKWAASDVTPPPYILALESQYGKPSQDGFGSTVLYATAANRWELESLAIEAYRYFVGDLWDRWGETAWMSSWKLVSEPAPGSSVEKALRSLDDPLARSSAEMILDSTPDPKAGQVALSAAFDDPDTVDRLVYTIGDGNAMSGLLIAARRANGEATFLVFLLD